MQAWPSGTACVPQLLHRTTIAHRYGQHQAAGQGQLGGLLSMWLCETEGGLQLADCLVGPVPTKY